VIWLAESALVGVVFLVFVAVVCWATRDRDQPSLARLADPEPLPGERPLPFDTGPLLLVSDLDQAGDELYRYVERSAAEAEAMIALMFGDAERRIPGRWR
jgi:hypothetical protein